MPLIRITPDGARVVEQDWLFISLEELDDPLPDDCKATVPMEHYLDASMHNARHHGLGVRLSPEDDPSRLAPYLDDLRLIEIAFPKYTDGRGFSQAQIPCRRYGFKGEIRAVGQVLRDEIFKMGRCGFDAFEFTPTSGEPADVVAAALQDFTAAYQPGADARRPIFAHRSGAPVSARTTTAAE